MVEKKILIQGKRIHIYDEIERWEDLKADYEAKALQRMSEQSRAVAEKFKSKKGNGWQKGDPMKKLIFGLILALSLNIFAAEVDKYITTEAFKKDIVERILKGDKKAEKIWEELEDKLQTLLEAGDEKAEEELQKWDDLLAAAGL